MAQLVRAPPCHGGGRGFESRLGRSGSLAQLGEHLPYKQRVTGSSPVTSTCISFWCRNAGVAELADAQDLKSCCSDTVPVRFRSPALRGLKCWSSFSIWGFLFLCWDKKNPPAHRSVDGGFFSAILFFFDRSLISCGWFTLDQCCAELCAADWNVMYQGV